MLFDDERAEWVDPATGVRCMIRRSPASGRWLGYVEVPPEVEDLDTLHVYGGITGGFDNFVGFDTNHAWDDPPKDEAWVRAEVARLAAQVAALRPTSLTWPRWSRAGSLESGYGVRGMLTLREENLTLVACLIRTVKPRGDVLAWTHLPKKCSEQKVPSLEAGAEALVARGLPPVPPELLRELAEWVPSSP